jgi:hypothetical protein
MKKPEDGKKSRRREEGIFEKTKRGCPFFRGFWRRFASTMSNKYRIVNNF